MTLPEALAGEPGRQPTASVPTTGPRPWPPRRLRSRFWLTLLACLGGLLCPGGFCGNRAEAVDRGREREENLARLSRLSAPERENLKRNLQEFRALPAAEKERLRALQRALQADAQSGGRLNRVLDAYYDWLKTLSPGQRSDLRNEADPVRRSQQVGALLQRQESAESGDAPRRRRLGFTSEDLAAVMPLLEEALIQNGYLTPDRLGGKEGLARYSLILQAANPADRRDPNPPWLKPELINAMIAAIPNEERRRQLGREQERRRGARLLLGIYGGIQAEFRRRAQDIDPAKLEEFFVQMKGEQQDEVMRVPYGSQEMKLRQMYMRAHTDEFPAPPPQPPWLNQFPRPGGRGPGFGPPSPPVNQAGPEGDGGPDGDVRPPDESRGPKRAGQGAGPMRARPRPQRRPEGDAEPAS
jgi:hypothetical protein